MGEREGWKVWEGGEWVLVWVRMEVREERQEGR